MDISGLDEVEANKITVGELTTTSDVDIHGNATVSGTIAAATGSTIGSLTLANGSITDSTGAISFGDENLTTTGTITAGGFTTTGTWTFDEFTSGTTGITTVQESGTSFNDNDTSLMTSGAINNLISNFSGDLNVYGNATVSGTIAAATDSTIGNLTLADGSITDSSGAISFGDENLTTTGTITAFAFEITGVYKFPVFGTGVQRGISTVQDSGTSFNDNDTSLMTASAINNLISNFSGDSSITGDLDVYGNATVSGTIAAATDSTIGNLTLADGSITDSSGAISFGDENLTTTGTVTAGGFTTTGIWTFDEFTSGTIEITTVQDSGTSFNDNDTSLMTAGAINNLISNFSGDSSITGDLDVYGNATVSGDLTVSGDITGDVTGTASTATVATTVTITDNESTNEDNAIIFTAGGDVDGGNLGLESDGTLTYNPSTGKITATGFIGALTGNADTATVATTVTITDNESTNEDNAIIFTAGGDVDGGNLGLESDGTLTYNPSTGTVTAGGFTTTGTSSFGDSSITGDLDVYGNATVSGDLTVSGDITGTTSTATVATTVTITDNESTNEDNAIIFTAGGDVDGGNLGLESDGTLTYNPSTGTVTAGGFTTIGTSSFGDLDVYGNATVSGTVTGATFEPDGDTSAGDNAAIGHTAVDGLILTGQGSTNDVTIKNDADEIVFFIETGTTVVQTSENFTCGNLLRSEGDLSVNDDCSIGGGLTVSGGIITLSNGSIISSTTAGTLLLTEDLVKTSGAFETTGDATIGGILDVNNDTNIHGNATVSGDVSIVGDLAVNSSFAANVSGTFGTFSAADTTPSVAAGNLWKTHASAQTLTTFDDGVAGQTITVISTAAVIFDVTTTTLKGGSTDITTATGDITTWTFDGTNWYLGQFMDVDVDMSSVGNAASKWNDIADGDGAITMATTTGNITIDAQGSDTDIIFKGTDDTTDITAMTIDMSEGGNVGIGNTAPGSQLEISKVSGSATLELSSWSATATASHAGALKFQKSGTATVNTFTAADHTTAGEILGRVEAWGVNDGDSATLSSYIEFANDAVSDADSVPGKIVFATSDADDAGTPTVRMTIDDSGNVGIGTTSPAAKLEVTGDATINGELTTTGEVDINNNLTVLGNIIGNGNVGIGNTVPGSQLEISKVSGSATLELSSWSATATASHAGALKFQKSGTATVNTFTATDHTTAGEILGRVEAWGVNDGDSATLSSYIEFANDAVSDPDSVPGKIVFATSDADDAGTPTVRMTIDDSGNVGIGTTSPSATTTIDLGSISNSASQKLLIEYSGTGAESTAGDGGLSGTTGFQTNCPFKLKHTAYNSPHGIGLEMGHFSDTGVAYIQNEAANTGARDIFLQPYSGDVIIGDKVGIGTTSPTNARLVVKSAGNDGHNVIELTTNDGTGGWIGQWDGSTNNYNLEIYMKNNTGSTYHNIGQFENSNLDSGNFFTGQHRNIMNTSINENHIGLIVSSTGNIVNVNNSLLPYINESLPICVLTTSDNDKKVFGVVSDKEDTNLSRKIGTGTYKTKSVKQNRNEQRFYINSVGEGSVWVCNKTGTLENGDYITTTTVVGYGGKQSDEILKNYTVAKITTNCDFSLTKIAKQKLKVNTITETKTRDVYEDVEKTETKTEVVYDDALQKYVQKTTTETKTKREQMFDTVDLYNESGVVIGTHQAKRTESYTQTYTDIDYDANGDVQYEDDLDDQANQQMVYKYDTRFLQADGTHLTDETDYNTRLANGETVYIACFVGCTYHCG